MMFLSSLSYQLAAWPLCLPIILLNASPVRNHQDASKNLKDDRATLCSKAIPNGVKIGHTNNVSIISNHVERTYLINIPEGYQEQSSSPLILSFHGGKKTSQLQLELDNFTSPNFNSLNAIMIYPQGINSTWQGTPGSSANDTGFVSDLLASLSEDYCIDSTRIYATGKSDGGGFANTLACNEDLSTKIAAFAPVSGAFYQPQASDTTCQATRVNIQCKPGRTRIPMIEFHGGNDSTINYVGGTRKSMCLPAISHFVQSWAVRNKMSTLFTSSLTALDTVVFSYGTGNDTGLVTHVFDTNIGHDWPSTLPNADNTLPGRHVASFNATSVIMEFFSGYSLSNGCTQSTGGPVMIAGNPVSTFTNRVDAGSST